MNPFPYLSHAYMAFELERRHPGLFGKIVLASIIGGFALGIVIGALSE